MASVEIRDIRKNYGALEVIHGLSIDIADGEFIVIVGPSGCGKSTLLRMVAGLEGITSGKIRIGDRVVNDLEPAARNIAMVFQNYALYPHMNVFDNMAYGLKIAKLPRNEIKNRVNKAAELLQLSSFLERKPRALSGGQRQRVAMGRAIVRDPAVFLFDEPLSNLDAKLRVQMRLEIKNMQKSIGRTALYVTHDQIEAMTLADRLIVMNEGRADQIDTPLAVYSKPATMFVAGFIGSPAMNLLEATPDNDGKRIHLSDGVMLQNLPIPTTNSPFIVGIRAEHLDLVAPENADCVLRVEAIETLGADTLLHGRIQKAIDPNPKSGITTGNFVARIPGEQKIRHGEQVPIAFKRDHLHFFNAETKKRIEP